MAQDRKNKSLEINKGEARDRTDVLSFGEIFSSITCGASVNGEDRPAQRGEAGVLRLSAVNGGVFRPSENKAVLGDERDRLGIKVATGAILISRSNTLALVGAAALVETNHPDLYLPDLLWQAEIRNRQTTNAKWLSYILASDEIRTEIKARASGTSGSMKKLSMASFRGIVIRRPPLSEQEAIAAVLSAWDLAIEQTTALIAAKDRLKQGLMQQLLSGRRRFKGHRSNWRTVPMGEVLTEVRRHVPVADETKYRLVSVRRRSGGIFDRPPQPGHAIGYSRLMTIATGDFLVARRQVIHGAMTIVGKRFDGAFVSDAYATLVPKDSATLHMPFFDLLSQGPALYHAAYRCSYGVAIEKMVFNLDWFLRESVAIPTSVDEQKEIADIFTVLRREMRSLERRLDALKQQKRGLMQQLLTGHRRVPPSLLKQGAKP